MRQKAIKKAIKTVNKPKSDLLKERAKKKILKSFKIPKQDDTIPKVKLPKSPNKISKIIKPFKALQEVDSDDQIDFYNHETFSDEDEPMKDVEDRRGS